MNSKENCDSKSKQAREMIVCLSASVAYTNNLCKAYFNQINTPASDRKLANPYYSDNKQRVRCYFIQGVVHEYLQCSMVVIMLIFNIDIVFIATYNGFTALVACWLKLTKSSTVY